MPAAGKDLHVHGHCYCGGVTFEVMIPAGSAPVFSTYCHCDSCRRAHAAPLYHVVCVEEAMFRITQGEHLLKGYARTGNQLNRVFCSTCGSKIMNRFGDLRFDGKSAVAFFPNLLEEATQHAMPDMLRPKGNYLAEECVLERGVLNQIFGLA